MLPFECLGVLPDLQVQLIETDYNCRLLEIAQLSVGLSGRTLRKIPFLAHVFFINTNDDSTTLFTFLDALKMTVTKQICELNSLSI